MREFKGTEGLWVVVDGSAAGKQVISESAPKTRRNIASCGGQRREENANLIAAAPELLEALQDMVESYQWEASMENPSLLKARAAIAKALGD